VSLPTNICSLDCETDKIAPENVHPRLACVTFWDPQTEYSALMTPWDDPQLERFLRGKFELAAEGKLLIVNQSIHFDCWVLIREYPNLFPVIEAAYRAGNVLVVEHRAMLIELQTHGGIDMEYAPDGSAKPLDYRQADLTLRWIGKDVFASKSEDSWRTRYGTLIGVPKDQWSEEPREYALNDPKDALAVWQAMTAAHGQGCLLNSLESEQAAARGAFAAAKVTQKGIRLDPVAAQKLLNATREEMIDVELLVQAGFRNSGSPSRPYANGAQSHVEGCTGKPCGCPPKMAKHQPAKANDIVTRKWVRNWIAKADPDAKVPLTDGGKEKFAEEYGENKIRLDVNHEFFDENPRMMKIENEQLEELLVDAPDGVDVVQKYLSWKKASKLWSSFLPGMMWDKTHQCSGKDTFTKEPGEMIWARRVHGNYGIIKKTQRMSGWGGSLYPSANHQQQDPRVRSSYVADPGYVLVSVDYASLELYSAAATMKRLFGESKLHDLLTSKRDPHGFLGAILAADMAEWGAEGLHAAQDDLSRLDIFEALPKDFYKFWRTFAKPVGLGFPGGLGIRTMRSIAFAMYGVRITDDQAKRAKELWFKAFPEFERYLGQWIHQQKDGGHVDDEGLSKFQYCSPMGVMRRNCSYTAAANGNALQTPPAEAMREVLFEAVCATQTQGSPLFGSDVLAPIHDEILAQVPIFKDYSETILAIEELKRIMVDVMSAHLGIEVKVEAECMYRWYKFAPEGLKFDEHWPVDSPSVYFNQPPIELREAAPLLNI
jgi:hypothetical protein